MKIKLSKATRDQARIQSFEGLRGIMAIAVLNCHIVVLYPLLSESFIWKGFRYSPFSIFASGGFGVSYFFVLSSFGVWFNNYEKDWKIVAIGYFKRYFRLLPTLIMSDFLACVFFKNGFYFLTPGSLNDAGIIQFSRYVDRERSYWKVIYDAAWHVFVSGGSEFVAPFWTIRGEMIGGCIAIVLLLIMRNMPYKRKVMLIIFASVGVGFLGNEYYYSTIAGIILCEFIRFIALKKWNEKKWHCWWIIGTLTVFELVVLWNGLSIGKEINYSVFCGIAWAMIMAYVFFRKNGMLCKILESKPVGMMGKLSFQIYGLHWTLISSVGAFLISRDCLGHGFWYGLTVYLVVVILTFILAYALWWVNNVIQRNIVDKIFNKLGIVCLR